MVVVVVEAGVLRKFAVSAVPRTEIPIRVLVDRRPELARLEMMVHTEHLP